MLGLGKCHLMIIGWNMGGYKTWWFKKIEDLMTKKNRNCNTVRVLEIELNFLCPLPPSISSYAAWQLHVTAKASPPISLLRRAMKTIHLKFVPTPSMTSHPHEVPSGSALVFQPWTQALQLLASRSVWIKARHHRKRKRHMLSLFYMGLNGFPL